MVSFAVMRRDAREIIGQMFRLLVAPASLIGTIRLRTPVPRASLRMLLGDERSNAAECKLGRVGKDLMTDPGEHLKLDIWESTKSSGSRDCDGVLVAVQDQRRSVDRSQLVGDIHPQKSVLQPTSVVVVLQWDVWRGTAKFGPAFARSARQTQ
jgi:hypothetical protein